MQPAIGFTFTALLASSLTLVSTLAILVPMFLHLRRERDVALLLIFNTYLTIFAFSLVLLSTTVNVLRADLFGEAILRRSEHDWMSLPRPPALRKHSAAAI